MIDLHHQLKRKNTLLEHFALTDPLTGLPNHRAIEAWASHELPAAVRHGFSFWVVMIDLDHFTDVNDAHGHDAGDLVLGTFGEILKGNTRSSDISGRIGGEEFFTSSRMPTNRICRRSSYAHAPS
ncbi:MAG TPA: GGDEF domain-containing protein [Vicinamibacterales bacterium]